MRALPWNWGSRIVGGKVLTKILEFEGIRPDDRRARRRQSRSSSNLSPWVSAALNKTSADSRPEPRGPRERASYPMMVLSCMRKIGW